MDLPAKANKGITTEWKEKVVKCEIKFGFPLMDPQLCINVNNLLQGN
jgi:hypothetical protein